MIGAVSLVWDRLNWYGLDDHVVADPLLARGIGCALFAADCGAIAGAECPAADRPDVRLRGRVEDRLGRGARRQLLPRRPSHRRPLRLARSGRAGIDDPPATAPSSSGSTTWVRCPRRRRAVDARGRRLLAEARSSLESVIAASFLAPLRGAWRRLRTGPWRPSASPPTRWCQSRGSGRSCSSWRSSERRLSWSPGRMTHYAAASCSVLGSLWSALH